MVCSIHRRSAPSGVIIPPLPGSAWLGPLLVSLVEVRTIFLAGVIRSGLLPALYCSSMCGIAAAESFVFTLLLISLLLCQEVAAIAMARRIASRSTTPAPISVTPSQDWDGNDGPWSTFTVQIGTPPQNVKLLISTAASQTWAVATEGCGSGDPTDCAQLRGGEYNYTSSSTWVPSLADTSTDIYALTLESELGYGGNGRYGFDDITLGFQGSGGPTLNNQTVVGIATKQYFLGLFGITPRATTFSSNSSPVPSFMENLRSQSKIPSSSWGYTAGNQYRLNQVLGSLTLGGYDASRFIPNNFSVPFAPDINKDLTVQIESIDTNTGVSLLPSPIMAFLDSTVPYIYLPVTACTLFETAFGIIWNDTAQLYIVNTTQHVLLQTQNPSVTFTLGSNSTSSAVNITLPYAAFDLTASYPLVNETERYFPLQRAYNDTQYTLGRTFFQEAYVITDYERRNFSVSQCKWVSAPPNIVAILPPGTATSQLLPTGAIAGIAVGGFLIILVIALLYFFWWRPRQRKRQTVERAAENATSTQPQEYIKPELESTPATQILETDGRKVEQVAEIATTDPIFEMPAEEVAAEMTGQEEARELDGRAERRWSWVRGESRVGSRSARSPRTPGTDTLSSMSSGMGSLASQLVSPESPNQRRKEPRSRL